MHAYKFIILRCTLYHDHTQKKSEREREKNDLRERFLVQDLKL